MGNQSPTDYGGLESVVSSLSGVRSRVAAENGFQCFHRMPLFETAFVNNNNNNNINLRLIRLR